MRSGPSHGRLALPVASACLVAILCCLAAATVAPVPASAAIHSGQVTDPSGDGPDPTRDLVAAEASYDPAGGRLTFTLDLAGPPDPAEPSQYLGAVGRYQQGACSSPNLILGTVIPGSTTIWLREDDGQSPAESSGDAERSTSGNRITLSATDPDLKGLDAQCAIALVSDAETGAVIHDETAVFPIREVKVAKLKAKLQGLGSTVRPGRGVKAKVRVANPGNGAATGVRLKLRVKGKAKVSPKAKKLGRIGPGKSRVVAFRVKAARQARGSVRVTARASARNAKGSAAAGRVKVKVPRPRPRPPATNAKGLAGKLFWGFESYNWNSSSEVFALYFVNRKFVHLGMPKGGLPRCGRVTAKTKGGKTSSGCVRYSYDARSGRVKVGSSAGTYRRGNLKLSMKGRESEWAISTDAWYGTSLPRPGARFKVKLRAAGYSGLCGITPSCTTWNENLILERNGKFGRQTSSLTTGGGGALPFVAIGKLGPNERGRYQVLSRSRIRFRYASGKVKTQTIVVQLNKRNRPDPAREGLLIDDDWFYHDTD